jgi:hypothetical protein
MSQASTKGYLSLPVDEESDGESKQPFPRSTRNLKFITVSLFCALSVLINLLLLSRLSAALKSPRHELSKYGEGHSVERCVLQANENTARLPADEYIVYSAINEFTTGNDTEIDKAWSNINTDAAAIALTDEWAEERGIETGERFPWDFNKGLYAVLGFHELHCLVSDLGL